MSLRAVVLLAGSVRATELSRSIGRSLLDLPLDARDTVLSLWQSRVETMASHVGLARLPIRIIINQAGHAPRSQREASTAPVSVEHDRIEYRGTGGALRDVAEGYGEGDAILVANGAQVMTEPLELMARDLIHADADVSLVSHEDGTPTGLFLLRCGALRDIQPNGFVDLKEQVLPRLAGAGRSIHVLRRSEATGVAVRTLDGYLEALRVQARLAAGRPMNHDPYEEDWAPTFSLIESGARIGPGATIHDSVVLDGGIVGAGAVVVRSVVCPHGAVVPDATVSDRIIASDALAGSAAGGR